MKIQKNKSLTLTELLISISLILIIMLGVISIEYAIRRSRRVSAYGGKVSMLVSSTVIHIINNASDAIGHPNNKGIGVTTGGGLFEVLWVRVDTDATPSDYSDDTWHRTTFDRDGTKDIVVCIDTGHDLSGIGDTSACTGTEYTLMKAQEAIFTLVEDAGNLDYYLEITITSRYDPLSSETSEVLNPSSSYTARVTPLSHTW